MMRRGPEEDGAQRDSASGCCRPGPGPPPSAGLHSDPDPGPPSPVSTFAFQGRLGVGVPMAGPSAQRYPSPTSVLGSSGQRRVRKPPGSENHGCGHGHPRKGRKGPGSRLSPPAPRSRYRPWGGSSAELCPPQAADLGEPRWAPLVGGSRSPCASITSGSEFGEPSLSASGH